MYHLSSQRLRKGELTPICNASNRSIDQAMKTLATKHAKIPNTSERIMILFENKQPLFWAWGIGFDDAMKKFTAKLQQSAWSKE